MSALSPISQISLGKQMARSSVGSHNQHFFESARKRVTQLIGRITPQRTIRSSHQHQSSLSQIVQAPVIQPYQAAALIQPMTTHTQSNKVRFIELFTGKFEELNANHSQLTSGKSQLTTIAFKGVTLTRTTNKTLPTPFGIDSDNTADSVANKIADIIYFRYKNVIEELAPSGLETLTNFFISAVGNKFESPELIFNSSNDDTLNRKISRCIRALREHAPKAELKCKTSDRKWTIKGVIFKSPALVNGKLWKPLPYETWFTSSKLEAERCEKYREHPQIISNEEDAEREGFQRPNEPKVVNLPIVSQPTREIQLHVLNKTIKAMSHHPITTIATVVSGFMATSFGVVVYLLRSRTTPYQIPAINIYTI